MKRLYFTEIALLSHRERGAMRMPLNRRFTILRGENHTGKSSAIKSLYHAFGADTEQSEKWREANACVLVRFTLDGDAYAILRDGARFSLFDSDDTLLWSKIGIVDSLAPALADLLEFRLRLTARGDVRKPANPAHAFLPFYIDQDLSWSRPWAAFKGLAMFARWQDDTIAYHTGIRPRRWFEIQEQEAEVTSAIRKQDAELKALRRVATRLEKDLPPKSYEIQLDAFKKEMNALLLLCRRMAEKRDAIREEMSVLESDRLRIKAQIDIVEEVRSEVDQDYEFATESPDHVECPTCGVVHENTFAERFRIAHDHNYCVGLKRELVEELSGIERKLADARLRLTCATEEYQKIQALLTSRQEDVSFGDLLQNEGRRAAKTVVGSTERRIRDERTQAEGRLSLLRKEKRGVSNKRRTKEINEFFREKMSAYLRRLDLPNSSAYVPDKVTKIPTKAFLGSSAPRAILAYFFAIVHVIERFGDGVFCPIGIDAINQQEQDPKHLLGMLEFIRDEAPEDAQLIIGAYDTLDVDYPGDLIHLHRQRDLLEEPRYEEVAEDLLPLLDQHLAQS